jgi:hypothetical protein
VHSWSALDLGSSDNVVSCIRGSNNPPLSMYVWLRTFEVCEGLIGKLV